MVDEDMLFDEGPLAKNVPCRNCLVFFDDCKWIRLFHENSIQVSIV